MHTLRQLIIDTLPHGIVLRVARRREEQRRARLVSDRQRVLRPVAAERTGVVLPRLNMGCGFHLEPGWYNADSHESAEVRVELKEGEPLPFADGSLEAVFSEHFLEHITYPAARHFMRESFRILRPGGVFRVSCPDLDVITGFLQEGNTSWRELAAVYESIGDFAPGELDSPAKVVNWAFYGHEHRFLWNLAELTGELERAGFGRVERVPFGESQVSGFAIERRRSEAFYSLIVEARKP